MGKILLSTLAFGCEEGPGEGWLTTPINGWLDSHKNKFRNVSVIKIARLASVNLLTYVLRFLLKAHNKKNT